MAYLKRMGKKPANVSDPSEPTGPCDRCRSDATTDPCGPCPLYGAYLERFGLADEPPIRAAYDAWARQGGWLLLWKLHEAGMRRPRLVTALSLKAAYPRVNPDIIAHHLEAR